MVLLRSAAVALLALSVASCGYSPSSPSTPSTTGDGPMATVTIPMGAEVLGDRAFAPSPIEVTAGTTVTWMNTDTQSHTSTSNGAGWNSGSVRPGGRFSFVLDTPGTYPYHCAIHPGMVGTVVVR